VRESFANNGTTVFETSNPPFTPTLCRSDGMNPLRNDAVEMNGERSRLGCCSARPRAEHQGARNALISERVCVCQVGREGAAHCARGGRAP